MAHEFPVEKEALDEERFQLLRQVEDWLEWPVVVLGFVWLVLLIIELIRGLNPFLEGLTFLIWGIFILDFLLRFVLAPQKGDYLKRNWLTVLSLLVPALRVLRIASVVRLVSLSRAARGLRLFRLVSSANRGMRAARASMGRRGIGYVALLTLLVAFAGAGGIYAFEYGATNSGIHNFGDALWWSAMMMTTMGSQYWPQTGEGRILAFLLALYAFAVFGYVTATLATFFIGREAEDDQAEIPGMKSIEALRAEITALRAEVRELSDRH